MMNVKLANWNAPSNIIALSTTRVGGDSKAPYGSNNLALHVGDNEDDVQKNRRQLREHLQLPNEPAWLEQTHSTVCIIPEEEATRNADAAITRSSHYPLTILTADCLPITLCNQEGTEIAAIHAGWRGLYNGIIENTVKKMHSKPDTLIAWIGPAISQKHYETGEEVFTAFTKKYKQSTMAFKNTAKDKWLANLPLIAELILNFLGIKSVYQSNLCTFELKNELYSYRRTPQTGRIATLIWFRAC